MLRAPADFAVLFAVAAGCATSGPMDLSFAADTSFPHEVVFEIGAVEFRAGDSITITEIRGTRKEFSVGGIYLVKGTYSLASRDEATILFSVTAMKPGGGHATGLERARAVVERGTGTFEVATKMAYEGHPHLTFYPRPKGSGFGGVYFGSGPFLLREKSWSYLD